MSVLDKFSKKTTSNSSNTFSNLFDRKQKPKGEDGRTSLRGILQYASMEEIYQTFGEAAPEDIGADFDKRAEKFRLWMDQQQEKQTR